ncbi:MAG: T9SS type A sorting domain-containing protein, partial [Thermoanaerobaculia bacterium]|nr:T9SS type A sorting domain-containing protein [Thermoanaerobaculia bacterium]
SFKAVKVGDVNCSATYNSAQAPPGPRGLATLDLPDMALSAGQTYELPLRVATGAEWTGFQFAVELDPEAAGIEAVVPGALPGLDENAFAQTRPGLLTVSWFDAQARHLPAGETILTLKIRALTDVVLSEAAHLNTQRIGAEAYTGDGQTQALQLYFAKPATGTVQFFAPRPNPTAGAASFPIRLEQAGPVELKLSDPAGKVVFQQTFNLEAGLQELAVPAAVLVADGVYVWRVKAGSLAHAGKLVKI